MVGCSAAVDRGEEHVSESVVVIGNFDGVHPGHRKVLAEARAAEPGLPLIVVTFWPHPASVVRPDGGPKLLTNLDDRVALLREAGADDVRVIEFTRELSQLSPAEFVDRFLIPLRPARIVVGENFRFGHKASGSVATLAELGEGRFAVTALPLVHVRDEETCSSAVRAALTDGDVERAAAMLGRPFRFSGIVCHGDHRGRELGFPTANLPVPHGYACPADGVYAGWVTRLDGRDGHGNPLPGGAAAPAWPAAISVGTNPTFDGADQRVESFVLDRTDLELYDAPIAVDFVARIRGQVRFDGIEALIEQMDADVAETRRVLADAAR
ncbi:MAG: bifunctional riboflavin kinase/FAD synthetase [Propioniciclava sp.]|uniref:bifunctional riboflavin kinase/FAD synthetase n=1 Tax=Propioniciclava sp. TaxID=2038686 RepID=UPI0039E6070A